MCLEVYSIRKSTYSQLNASLLCVHSCLKLHMILMLKKTITTRVFRMVSQLVFNGFILFLGTGTFLYSLFLPSYLIKQKDYIRNFDFIKIDVFLKSLKVHEFFLLFFGKPIILHVFISFNYFFFFSFFFLLL